MIRIGQQIVAVIIWNAIGILITFFLNFVFFDFFYDLFQKIFDPGFFDFVEVVYLLCLIAFCITFILQRKLQVFSRFQRISSITLIIVIIYLAVNFLGALFSWSLPNWFTYPLRL